MPADPIVESRPEAGMGNGQWKKQTRAGEKNRPDNSPRVASRNSDAEQGENSQRDIDKRISSRPKHQERNGERRQYAEFNRDLPADGERVAIHRCKVMGASAATALKKPVLKL